MTQRKIQLGEELFKFTSEQEWINKAQQWFGQCRVPRDHYICLDKTGRVCIKGSEFMRATREDTYPITVYILLV